MEGLVVSRVEGLIEGDIVVSFVHVSESCSIAGKSMEEGEHRTGYDDFGLEWRTFKPFDSAL